MKNGLEPNNRPFKSKVLIVDDEPRVAESISEALEKEPYEIIFAANGKQGLEKCKNESPQLIILDLRMPEMDGIEFLKQIKLTNSDPYSVIILTGHGDDHEIKECFKLGISVFLRKPFNIYELRGLVKHSISSKQMELQIKNLAKFPSENPNPVLRITKDGAIIYANEACSSLLKVWNCRPYQYLPEPLQRLIIEVYDSGSSQEIETVCESNVFSLKITPVVDEDYVNIYGFDITKRKQMEEEILKLSTAVEQSPSVVVITDVTGKVEYVNPKFSQLTGYTSDETIGKDLNILKSGAQSNDIYQQLWLTIASGGDWHGELHNRRKNGDYYWEAASISPLRNPENTITHFIKVAEDITRQKQAEDDLRKHHLQLEDMVEIRTKELHKTYEMLVHSEKLSAIGKLSASIAHEFNNPIFGIMNVLERTKKEGVNDDNRSLVVMAISECERIANLIKKLQDFHRPSAGNKVSIDIHILIDDVLALMKKKLTTRKIQLKKTFAEKTELINIVPDQIKQVILNLLNNAEQAIPEEGGAIEVGTNILKEEIEIFIKDTGAGIAKGNIDSIFEPFFTTKSIKGTGLGLSISYGIMKEHGGNIKVESKEGDGTTFTLTLPLTD